MLKKLLKEEGISVYRLAKDTNLPYTTVNEIVLGKKDPKDCSLKTISTIANYFHVPVNSFLKNSHKMASNYLDAKKNSYIFRVIENTDLLDIKRIHPLKQKEVINLSKATINDKRIAKIIIFGSATNITCNIKSDLDIAIEINKGFNNKETKNSISEEIEKSIGFNVDIIWLDKIDKNSYLYKNIERGVEICQSY